MHIVDKIINKYQTNNSLYIGEKVTITEHMVQTAMLAEQNHSSESLICACLLHDYGHFIIEDPDELVKNNKDGNHESIGYEYLKNFFKKEIVQPIKYHVLAKRYLARDKKYYNHLSDASKISLKLQGGILSKKESNDFQKIASFEDAIKLRKFDEIAKKTNIKMKSIYDYKDLLTSKLL